MDEFTGWIKLSRKLLQSKFYLGEKFTKTMCWIDLLLLAQWRKERTFFLRGIEVSVKRGQVAMALTDLHKRWNLSINTVRSRLKEMVNDGRISLESNNVVTRITILNWEKYQGNDYISDYSPQVEAVETSTDVEKNADEYIKVEKTEEVKTDNSLPLDTEVKVSVPVLSTSNKKPKVDYDFVVRLYHSRCPSLPKVLKLSDKRRLKIRVRFEEMGYSYETMQQIFDKAEASRFIRGDNNRGWRADFDWIFTNGSNWVKILEGKYDNKPSINETRYETQSSDRYAKRRGVDTAARDAEDYSDTL